MQHWKEPVALAGAQRTGYSSPVLTSAPLRRVRPAPVAVRAPTAGLGDMGTGFSVGAVLLVVAGAAGFWFGMSYQRDRMKRAIESL